MKAQGPPPCNGGTLTITNNCPFAVNLCLQSIPPIGCINVPPSLTIQVEGLPDPIRIVGVSSAGMKSYPFVARPAPPPFWVPGIALPPTGQCCNVLYDPATCVITINPAGPPPCPNP